MDEKGDSLKALRELDSRLGQGGGVAFNPDVLSDMLGQMDREDRAEALRRILDVLRKTWTQRGATRILEVLPPVRLDYAIAQDTAEFVGLVWGEEDSPARRWERREDFLKHQRKLAGVLRTMSSATGIEARDRWIERCRADPEWAKAMKRGAATYEEVLARESDERCVQARDIYDRTYSRSEARGGNPRCNHLELVSPCRDCHDSDLTAEESQGGSVARSSHDERMCGRPPDGPVHVLAKMVQEALEHDRRSARSANE